MPRKPSAPPRAVREPVQVYLAGDDAALLAHLTSTTGLSKAEILRRGIRSFARETTGDTPMLRFLALCDDGDWPENVAERHDEILAETYRAPNEPPR